MRAPTLSPLWLLCALACGAPPSEPEPAPEPLAPTPVEPAALDASWTVGESGWVAARFSSTPEPLPLNAMCELEVELVAAEGEHAPLEGVELRASAWMPDHAHGTNYQPRTTELGGGRYRVRGLLLHMPGYWELFLDVEDGAGGSDRVRYEVNL